MNPTDFHPIRTALMRSVHDQRLQKTCIVPEMMTASTPRDPAKWNARFGSRANVLALHDANWNNWDRMLVREELGSLDPEAAAASMDRLCLFEDMLASVKRDRHPIIDISAEAPELIRAGGSARTTRFEPSFCGSLYVHFGDEHPFFCLDNHRRPTGAYVHAAANGKGDVYGHVHLVSTTDDWEQVGETPFYETLYHHQHARVYEYSYDQAGNYDWSLDGAPGKFRSNEKAGRLLPLVKLGVDIVAGTDTTYDAEVRTEYFYGGPNVAPEHCRIDVAAVSKRPQPGSEARNPSL
jgi:hypothetical protein